MDVLSPLFQLLFRALVVVLPLTIGWLAFRRLMLSRSANAWIYATTCLLTAVTAAGLLPWTLGLAEGNWLFFLLSALSPPIWIGVIMICDPVTHPSIYDAKSQAEPDLPDEESAQIMEFQRAKPLILEKPDWPEAPVPVFRHLKPAANAPQSPQLADESPAKSLISVARDMRGNASSDARRPRLLPPPDRMPKDLPFLHRG